MEGTVGKSSADTPRSKNAVQSFLTRYRVCLLLIGVTLILNIVARLSPAAADLIGGTVGAAFRFLLSLLTSPFPFPLAEMLTVILPIAVLLLAVFGIRRVVSGGDTGAFTFFIIVLVTLLYPLYFFTLGVGYRITPGYVSLGLDPDEVGYEDAETFTVYLAGEINSLSCGIQRSENGSTASGMSADELSDELCRIWGCGSTRIKPLVPEALFTSAGINGMYFPFTGEVCVNFSYPDYTVVFSAAHEFAHRCGISREEEANFEAYRRLMNGGTPYLRYSAALSMYEIVLGDMSRADPERYRTAWERLSAGAKSDILAARDHASEHVGKVTDASDALNDAALKLNGGGGRASYGEAAAIAIAHYKKYIAVSGR